MSPYKAGIIVRIIALIKHPTLVTPYETIIRTILADNTITGSSDGAFEQKAGARYVGYGYGPIAPVRRWRLCAWAKKSSAFFAQVFTSFLAFFPICCFRGTPPKPIFLGSSSCWE